MAIYYHFSVSVKLKPEEIAKELMTNDDVGEVKVTQSGNCSCLMYDVEFLSKPGDQNPPTVSDMGVARNGPTRGF